MKGRSGDSATKVSNAINALEKALVAEVKRTGKSLSVKDIHTVVRKFKAKPSSSAPQGAPASPGFTQLLIAPFADVIDDGVEVSREAIPRAMIPAFEAAIDMLCGEETVYKCRGRCKSLTAHLQSQQYTPSGLKDKVVQDTTGFKVLTYIFSKVVMKFEDFENRRDWMMLQYQNS